jgi:hypothetical protein
VLSSPDEEDTMSEKPKSIILRETREQKPVCNPNQKPLTEGEDMAALNALLTRIRNQNKEQKK